MSLLAFARPTRLTTDQESLPGWSSFPSPGGTVKAIRRRTAALCFRGFLAETKVDLLSYRLLLSSGQAIIFFVFCFCILFFAYYRFSPSPRNPMVRKASLSHPSTVHNISHNKVTTSFCSASYTTGIPPESTISFLRMHTTALRPGLFSVVIHSTPLNTPLRTEESSISNRTLRLSAAASIGHLGEPGEPRLSIPYTYLAVPVSIKRQTRREGLLIVSLY